MLAGSVSPVGTPSSKIELEEKESVACYECCYIILLLLEFATFTAKPYSGRPLLLVLRGDLETGAANPLCAESTRLSCILSLELCGEDDEEDEDWCVGAAAV